MNSLIEKLLQSPYGLWIALGLLFIVFIGSILFIVNIIYLAYRRTLTSAANRLGGTVVYSMLSGPYLCLKDHNVESRISIRAGGKNNPPALVIERDNPLAFNFYILDKNSPQTLLCRGKKIKFQDSTLDEKLFIKSDAPDQAESFLQRTKTKEAIKFFMENSIDKIVAKKNKISLHKRGYGDDDFSPEKMNVVMSHLNSFSF